MEQRGPESLPDHKSKNGSSGGSAPNSKCHSEADDSEVHFEQKLLVRENVGDFSSAAAKESCFFREHEVSNGETARLCDVDDLVLYAPHLIPKISEATIRGRSRSDDLSKLAQDGLAKLESLKNQAESAVADAADRSGAEDALASIKKTDVPTGGSGVGS